LVNGWNKHEMQWEKIYLWFNEECMEKKTEMKQALRKFKEKDDNESRIQYWESRKAYERTVENKMYLWQEKVAECKFITQKEVEKVWEAIKNITRRKERTLNFCGTSSHEWKLFSRIVFYKPTGFWKE
jgi:ribosomal protein S21